MSKRAKLFGGIRAQIPILLGVVPFGLIYGIAAMEAGLPPSVAIAMSMIVFAGSSQFIAAQLFANGAVGLVIVVTTFIVNLRHALYSASVAPYVRHLLTDEAYAVSITHYRRMTPEEVRDTNDHWYFLGAGLTLWVSWQISSIVGMVLGAAVPSNWSLDFTLALTFIALLIPTLEDQPTVLAALAAGLTAVVAHPLPYNLGLIIAVLVGIGGGMLAERMMATARSTSSALSEGK
jgi:4-azaleucine resistance transporter AzlC